MTEAELIAGRINSAVPRLAGTLRFWGQWFGRPYDNVHDVVGCEIETDRLRIRFGGGEVLSVWAPRSVWVFDRNFSIKNADRVLWEWFYYGRPHLPENRYFESYTRTADGIIAEANADWYTPDLRPSRDHPAVELTALNL